MQRCLVTGAAGFIGSNIAERLIELGYEVIGVDCFTNYYNKKFKIKNIEKLLRLNGFTFVEKNLINVDMEELLGGVEYIFHQAGQPGVRASWGKDFKIYVEDNILATQKLLAACKEIPLKKFVFASSSSVYGDSDLPMQEDRLPKPVSPYGVSKLSAEHLCYLYWKNYGIPTIALRYFTVYGPRQRPDMAFNRFIHSILKGDEITVFGDGEQTRDYTYISDIVNANILAMESNVEGEVFNIGGGSKITVNEVIKVLEEITGKNARIRYVEKQKGDVKHTKADISKAQNLLNYKPDITIIEGLKKEYEWISDLY